MRWMVMVLMMAATAQAGEDPQMLAKYRANMMKGVGAHMGQLALVLKGKVERPDLLLENARAIEASAKTFHSLFPETTHPEKVKTEALAAVWTDAKGFEKANKNFLEASSTLVTALEKKAELAEIKAAWGGLGKSCGGCHDTFKKSDD